MKPSVEEQLQGTCRVLTEVVAPHVAEPFARSILDGLIANLQMLTGAIPAVAGFLRDDNRETADLLQTLRGAVPDDLAASLDAILRQPEPDPADTAALDARNLALRALLAGAVGQDALSPDHHRAIVRHMSARAARMPMRYVPTAPGPAPKEKT
jgi:hypothetical protein